MTTTTVSTPLVRLGNLFPEREVYAKCEFLSPSGSFKDRGAAHLLTKLSRASGNRLLHVLHDTMTRLDPGPHKATMLKPFHRSSRAEFCSACHKVHLDVPVNHYRWFRGFNEYDAWQGSGVSRQGARAFYYPDKAKDCADCHMPLVSSDDQGNQDGFVHSHRFPGANTAVPFVNHDEVQLQTTTDFLRAGILTLDIFAASEAMAPDTRTAAGAAGRDRPGKGAQETAEPQVATFFPDLPEVGSGASPISPARVPAAKRPVLIAPLDRADPFLRPGKTYRIDVVARTRGVGHFFPGGTVDAFDVWLELKAEDARGRIIYWSGFIEDGGKGPVEAGAHRYRSLLIDAHGNEINKRNAWAARALVYARLIPPGAADVGRFRVSIPRNVKGPISFTARMNYRKFHWYNTHFSYAGVADPAADPGAVSPDFDDRTFLFTGDTSRVSGQIREVPDLPVVVVAEDRVTLPVLPPGDRSPGPRAPRPQTLDRERFNDYGIGMRLQGDLVAARQAFGAVVALDPKYADGYVNIARVLIQEGSHEAAKPVLERALALRPDLASGHYFMALALKARGRYDEALRHLRSAAEGFPRDRVVRNQIGRILFLKRQHRAAIAEFENTLRVDPEDLTAHYNLMLCYRALGREKDEKREEVLYTRFKADEAAQSITGPYRRLNAEMNLERQPIHEHPNRRTPGTPPSVRPGPERSPRAAGRPTDEEHRGHPGVRRAHAPGLRPQERRAVGRVALPDAYRKPGALHRRDPRGRGCVPPQQRRLRKEIPAGNDGLGRGVSGLRRRRPPGPFLRPERRLAGEAPAENDANALPQPGRRDIRGHHPEGRAGGGDVRHRSRGRRLRQRRPRRPVHQRPGSRPPLPQQRGRDVRGRDAEGGGLRPRLRDQRHLDRLRQGRPAGSFLLQLRAVVPEGRHLLHSRRCQQVVLHPRVVPRRHRSAVPQQG